MTLTYFVSSLLSYSIIPAILTSILCCISLYILHKTIDMKKWFLTSFLTGLVLSTGSYAIILPILSVITIAQLLHNDDENTIKSLIIIYIVYLSNTVYTFIYTFSGATLNNIPLKNTLIQFSIMLSITIIVCLIIILINSKQRVHKEISPSSIRLRMILIISIPLSLLISAIFKLMNINRDKIDFILVNFVPQALPLICILLIVMIVYYYDKNVNYEIKFKREAEEKKEIEEYSHIIEDMYGETRKFKHDYMNMLTPLKEYIDSSNITELRSFFYNNILDMDKNIKWNNTNIDKLKYIKIPGLKGLLSSKIIKASAMNMDIKVEMVEDIDEISMNIMDLCRIMGILMDNAIEAASACEYPKVSICIISKNNYILIAVRNNFFGDKPLIHKIYEKGFSTKGNGRGLGLSTVKDMIDTKYDNVLLNTSIEGNMFIQELWIKSDPFS
jgi:two-component system, LytTR family, sensor histidine kinase AgrC